MEKSGKPLQITYLFIPKNEVRQVTAYNSEQLTRYEKELENHEKYKLLEIKEGEKNAIRRFVG